MKARTKEDGSKFLGPMTNSEAPFTMSSSADQRWCPLSFRKAPSTLEQLQTASIHTTSKIPYLLLTVLFEVETFDADFHTALVLSLPFVR